MAEVRDFPASMTERGALATVSEAEPATSARTSLPRGTAIHRYVLLEEVGSGAMGVVYAAYDYGLDRRVALKLVRDPGRNAARRRLLREAQALAQLSHPNVVTVFDVGTYRDQVFVAMEFVAGQTLRGWLEAGPRAWREVVDVFRRAGEGLAAAHAAGIVHRDFKPDNVLIDLQGRVRVSDFGLAVMDRGDESGERRVQSGEHSSSESSEPSLASGSLRGDSAPSGGAATRPDLTATNVIVGTPAYMAPEQRTAWGPIDGRADQFAFCVSLVEALCGKRPYDDDDDDEGEPGELRSLPAPLRRVMRRGLAMDPTARYASMDALLADLDGELGSRRRRVAAIGAGGAALAAAALIAGAAIWQPADEPACQGAAGKLKGVWDAARRERVRAAFAAASPGSGERALARIEPVLDRYARDWIAMHTESCEATHVRGEQSEVLLDLRTQCLDRRLAAMRATIDLFETADQKLVARAAQTADGLEPLDACANASALREVVPPPDPATRQRADQLRERLVRVRALHTAGKYREALDQAVPLAADARELGYRPLEAEVLTALGRIQRGNNKLTEAEETLYQAITAAEAGRNGEASIEAWLELLWVVGYEQMRLPEARRLARVARGAIERNGGNPRAEAKLEDWSGMMYFNEARYQDARAPLERALALFRKEGPERPQVATSLRHVADLEQQLGNHEKALGLYREARAITEKSFGPDHPNAVSLLGGEGTVLFYMGRWDEALAIFERGLAAQERVVGPENHTAATYHKFIGLARWRKGDLEGARAALERSVEVFSKVFGPQHAYVAPALSSLGMVLTAMERWDDARDRIERAVAIQRRDFGPDHPDVALSLDRIGQLEIAAGRPARAVPILERALAIREKHKDGTASDLAGTRYQLAQALRRSNRDRARVKRLLLAVLATFEKTGEADGAAFVRKWLATPGLLEPRP
jgi:eukaryotic-like serine/threonine-protein kinase